MILEDICKMKGLRLEEKKQLFSLEDMIKKSEKKEALGYNFKNALSKEEFSIIGEFKKASPSKGIIVENFVVEEILKYYEKLQVDGFSVLTEEDFFYGSEENLIKVESKSSTPILRKDFIIDPYQIYESKVMGASGILLIVSVLGNSVKDYYKESKAIGLEPLVEVHDERELEIAIKAEAEIIGINNRNLKTFETSFKEVETLLKYIPKDKIVVSESGIKNIEDLKRIKNMGVNAALIGEMFMRNINNPQFIKEFKEFRNGKD